MALIVALTTSNRLSKTYLAVSYLRLAVTFNSRIETLTPEKQNEIVKTLLLEPNTIVIPKDSISDLKRYDVEAITNCIVSKQAPFPKEKRKEWWRGGNIKKH